MYHELFSEKEKAILQQPLVSIIEVLESSLESIAYYWNKITSGQNPSLDFQLLQKIEVLVQDWFALESPELSENLKTRLLNDFWYEMDVLLFLFKDYSQIRTKLLKLRLEKVDRFEKLKQLERILKEEWSKQPLEFPAWLRRNWNTYSSLYKTFMHDILYRRIKNVPVIIDDDSMFVDQFSQNMYTFYEKNDDIEELEEDYEFTGGNLCSWITFADAWEFEDKKFDITLESNNNILVELRLVWLETKQSALKKELETDWNVDVITDLFRALNLSIKPITEVNLTNTIRSYIIGSELPYLEKENWSFLGINLDNSLLDLYIALCKSHAYYSGTVDSCIAEFQYIIRRHGLQLFSNNTITTLHYKLIIYGNQLNQIEKKDQQIIHPYAPPMLNFINVDYDPDITNECLHPFIRFSRSHISNHEKILATDVLAIPFKFSADAVVNLIKKNVQDIVVVRGDTHIYALDPQITSFYKEWMSNRLLELESLKEMHLLYPMLVNKEFKNNLTEWAVIGKEIMKQTQLLNDTIQSLLENNTYDEENITLLLQEAKQEGNVELTRDQILQRFILFKQAMGDPRKYSTLDKFLRQRVKQLITRINNDPDSSTIEILERKSGEQGRPVTIFRLRGGTATINVTTQNIHPGGE